VPKYRYNNAVIIILRARQNFLKWFSSHRKITVNNVETKFLFVTAYGRFLFSSGVRRIKINLYRVTNHQIRGPPTGQQSVWMDCVPYYEGRMNSVCDSEKFKSRVPVWQWRYFCDTLGRCCSP
jgi:hypothetical protein